MNKIELIKKLLRLAKSSNPNEAALALERAMELAAEHKVDVAKLDLDAEQEKLVADYMHVGERLAHERKLILSILQNFFNVDVCVAYPKVTFVGTRSDITVAIYVHDFLLRVLRKALSEFKAKERQAKRKWTTAKRQGFVSGWIYGIFNQLDNSERARLQGHETALAAKTAKESREEFMSSLYPSRRLVKTKEKSRNSNALANGFRAGSSVRIRQPLEGSAPAGNLNNTLQLPLA